jgi:MFS family permease
VSLARPARPRESADPVPAASWSEAARVFRPLLPLYGLDVLTSFTVGVVPPLLPLLAAQWDLSALAAGLVNTVYAIGRLAGSYPGSRLRAALGTRAAVFLGLAGLALGAVASGLAPTFPLFLAGRLLMGLGGAAAFLAIFAELLETTPHAWRGRLTYAFEAMAILSLALGGALGAAVAGRAGWRPVFVGAAPVLLTALVFWPLLDPRAGRALVTPPADAGPKAGSWPRLLPVHAASLSLSLTWSGLFATLVPLVGSTWYGLSPGALGLALGCGYVAELLGLLALGMIVDRVRREPVFLSGAISVAAGALLVAVGAHTGTFLLGLVLIGGGFAVWMIPAIVLADRVGGPLLPSHLATYRIAMDVGMISGPLVLGGLASLAGDRPAIGMAGTALVVGALALTRR